MGFRKVHLVAMDKQFTPIPSASSGQALTFPIKGLRGVGIWF